MCIKRRACLDVPSILFIKQGNQKTRIGDAHLGVPAENIVVAVGGVSSHGESRQRRGGFGFQRNQQAQIAARDEPQALHVATREADAEGIAPRQQFAVHLYVAHG